MNRFLTAFSLTLLFIGLAAAQTPDYTHWVDPFIGTGGHGHTFPGATMPFGMVQLSPDTRGADWDGSSGYHYSDDIIYGFSHTHLSGTGIPDYCDILFMPMVGEPQFFAKSGEKSVNGYASKFSHANEHAEPGYYSVKLDDDGIFAELTATPRVGLHRYTFPKSREANIILDLDWRDKILDSSVKIVSNTRIEGFRRSSSWAKDQSIFFVAEFSQPFAQIAIDGKKISVAPFTHVRGNELSAQKIAFVFNTNNNDNILLKVGISAVSIDGASENLQSEVPGFDFDKARAAAKAAWNKELSKIEVSGGTDAQMTTFYTALYHTMIHPNIFQDVDGGYRGLDGKVHHVASGLSLTKPPSEQDKLLGRAGNASDNYTVFSLWDTFRAAHPLYTIIDQKRTVDFINTFIRMYEQGGRLPVWELAGNETDTMIGYHAVSVIADAMAKGIKGFDYEKAYEAAKHSAMLDRDGLAAYKRRGYISQEDDNESVSKTLEYAYDDWCIAQMASVLYTKRAEKGTYKEANKDPVLQRYDKEHEYYSSRAGYYQNLFDPETGFMRPRRNGGFVKPFAPNEVTFNYTEGNAWVYSFFVPYDLFHLIDLYGGKEKFAAKLDELFTTKDKLTGREQPDITGLIGQYAHGNEPSHHIAYLFDYAGQAWKTQKYVRHILDEFYKPTPDGLIGNEDCGQMSAWYVLSSSSIYEVTPGSGIYAFGTPLFKEAKYHLENGKTFIIRAGNVSSGNIYVRTAKLNGKVLEAPVVLHSDIINGGLLDLDMTDKPVPDAFPNAPSSALPYQYVAAPIIGDGQRSFREFYKFTIKTISPDSKVYYTLDGSEPNERSTTYTAPVTITSDTTVKAIAVDIKDFRSQVAEATYKRIANDWTVKIDSKYSSQYTAGGDSGLIDGIRGTTNFTSDWQGYQGQDFVATVDLQRQTQIFVVGAGFLQSARSWIWMPTHVEFEVSQDGISFSRVADIRTDVAVDDMEPKIRDFSMPIKPTDARYVRVHAYSLGKIPSWHPGAGGDPWIFVDEILINAH